MNQRQYAEIMNCEGLQESIAVKAMLRQAVMHTNIAKKLELHAEAHPEQKEIFQKFIKKHDDKRIAAVWKAIAVAEEEKRQGWLFVENADDFMSYLEAKYDNDLSKVTEVEALQIQLTTLYNQLYQKGKQGEMG
ncbi:hypothetical protein QFF56_02900 [Ligilactobacillus animalis]|uniref:Uncharacterized protein n=1 Tax=Ligilactobacillus animalis TaxID=1605 RepID=A0AAJ6K577_9LACO|nr:hypothetical protein [Ligilactobacillus animalis]WHQ80648.1 hypothetical protein QFF56_02900 [Ligilactobacillus animalis]